jgi:RNA polymerase sigma-70 factor (ECF subfamily)
MARAATNTADELIDVGALYREHGRFVARVIRALTKPGEHVEDLLQETFLTAHRIRHTFDGKSKSTTWLYAIARHLCWRHGRSQGRWRRLRERVAALFVEPPPPEPLLSKELADGLQRVIDALPFKQREVFVLYELEEMSGGEIAALLQIPEGTVWTRLHHARRRFEKLAQERFGGKEGT